MKKSFVMFLTFILLIVIVSTAFAVCKTHDWHYLFTSTKTTHITISYPHGCIHCSNPHTHSKDKVEVTKYEYCPRCQSRQDTTDTYYTAEKCPKH